MGKRKREVVEEDTLDENAQDTTLDETVKEEPTNEDEYVEEFSEEKPRKKKKWDGEDRPERKFVTGMSFVDACKMLEEKPKCGLKIIKEIRHISIPYHMAGKKETLEAVQYICRMQVNKYRSILGGVVIAVDFENIQHVTQPLIIDDQQCLHCNVKVPTAVFIPSPQKKYEAVMTSISEKFMTALIFDLITVNMPADQNTQKALKGIVLEVGDVVSVTCDSIKIKRAMCQMNGIFHKIVKKGERIKREQSEKEESGEGEQKPAANSTKFLSDDEEE